MFTVHCSIWLLFQYGFQIVEPTSPDDKYDKAAEPSQDFDNLRLHREFAFYNETALQHDDTESQVRFIVNTVCVL